MHEQDHTSTPAVARANTDAFLLFDKQDDLAVVNRLRGLAIREYVYAFRQGGQMIYGLGVDGAEACKREMARMGEVIREDTIDLVREDAEHAYFRAYASRWAVKPGAPDMKLDTSVELKNQAKFTTRRDGSVEPNPFWFEQGGSKAMRNAVLNLVPEVIKQKIIDEYRKVAKVVEYTPEQADAATEEYHATMDRKDERDKKITDLKERWRELGLMKSQVVKILRAKGLSDSLAEAHVSWSSVDAATIDDLLNEARA